MRFLDLDRVGVYLDAANWRLERTKDHESKVVDLTCRVQPFTVELATALHPEVRPLLFTMTDAQPKAIMKAAELKIPNLAKQNIDCFLLPEGDETAGAVSFFDVEVSRPRVSTEKDVDGFKLVFYLTIGPVGRDDLEYITNWYAQQRFLTFRESQAVLDFANRAEDSVEPERPRRRRKAVEDAESESDHATTGSFI